jgi:hypothetical protein
MCLLKIAGKAFNNSDSQLLRRPVRTLPCHRLPAQKQSGIRFSRPYHTFIPGFSPSITQSLDCVIRDRSTSIRSERPKQKRAASLP